MFESIKKFMNWPENGVKNISEFGNYCKANWVGLLVLLVVILIVIYVVRKVIGIFLPSNK